MERLTRVLSILSKKIEKDMSRQGFEYRQPKRQVGILLKSYLDSYSEPLQYHN